MTVLEEQMDATPVLLSSAGLMMCCVEELCLFYIYFEVTATCANSAQSVASREDCTFLRTAKNNRI